MVRAKKHLGQHFLTDKNIAGKIANSALGSYNNVVEVGPGTGVLTEFLLGKYDKVFAYEVDGESVEYLESHFSDKPLTVLSEDFLKADFNELQVDEFVVIGNFPYHISSQIMFKIIENKERIPEMVGMFQKEVAERIASPSGNKTYGILSVITQAFYTTEYLFTVAEHVFNPPPKVQSGVLRIIRKENTEEIPEDLFRKIVKAGFNQRRKKLSNALKSIGIPEGLKTHNFLNLRAEQLSVEDFITLSKLWNAELHS